MAPTESLDTILTQITTSNNATALNHSLRTNLPKESRDTILASTLSSGQDPLTVLDMRENTLGVLWILAARLSTNTSNAPSWALVQEFCHTFIPEHARLAPDRVSALARGMITYANATPTPKAAIQPLYDLVRRYPPDASYLTSLHSQFALLCIQTQSPTALLPVLETPITNISLTLAPDLTYNDSLMYHYLGGIAFAELRLWGQAAEFFEIALSTPGSVPAALQLEALKKLRIVQLIASGKTAPLPKYTHALLPRLFKNGPYNAFVNAYPHNTDVLHEIATRDAATFASEKNTGLIALALSRAPRWTLKKLTLTYVTLSLSDIARAIKLPDEEAVRALLLDMIESADISASLDASGTVTFSDLPPALPDALSPGATPTTIVPGGITPASINALLASTQDQADLLRALEREMGKRKDYLGKAVKNRDDAWAPQAEEELFALGTAGVWADD
ncbi:hypothetical protein DXG01_001811, partial [Tephrocybe rancida]